ncbi:hypothetical protein [Pseudonocardia xinjiangensis]|uniref:Uncharacterized protein n=1 Tax=Pseudonocardia xinjiangensis TaxID=75289 RepID=A0ABX1RF05_9PSEU|nr:hypothetical protein [Pseudonocardia xinjiangensis]NMH77741.1 hypothetical protein [Pseudonocardia xinjiangensis]
MRVPAAQAPARTPSKPVRLRRRNLAAAAVLSTVAVATMSAPAYAATPAADTVSVTGAVGSPATYTAAALADLGEQKFAIVDPGDGPLTVSGVSLQDVIEKSAPTLPAGHNSNLRVTLTVTGHDKQAVTFALAELDPKLGANPAVLTTDGPDIGLVVPGDLNRSRSISDVEAVRVAVSDAGVAKVEPGSVQVVTADGRVTLTGDELNRLPAKKVSVTFVGPRGPETHTESGPSLTDALRAAGVNARSKTAVVAVGSDNYAAAVTPAEATLTGKQLILSTVEDGAALKQPRLVVDGDIGGGRYVSDVVTIEIGG